MRIGRHACACLLFLLAVLGGLAPAAFAAPARVVIVKSDNLASYNELVTAYSVQSSDSLSEYNLLRSPDTGRKLFAQLNAAPPDLVLAIGPLAAGLARDLLKKVPIVFVMVPDNVAAGYKSDAVTGILLYVQAQTQLRAFRQMFPDIKRVGVVHNISENAPQLVDARQAAAGLGLSLVLLRVDNEAQVAGALSEFDNRVDALWLLPDDVVLTPTAHGALIEYAARMRLPFMTLTPRLVKAGATCALAPDFSAIGRQAATLVNKILREGGSPALIPLMPPDGLQLAFNLQAAKNLKASAPELSLRVLTCAAEQAIPLTVFKSTTP